MKASVHSEDAVNQEHSDEDKGLRKSPGKTNLDWVDLLGNRPNRFPSRSGLNFPRIGFRSEAQILQLKSARREIDNATHALRQFLCRLQSLPFCLSIKQKGRVLSCQCNKQIPVPLSQQDSQVEMIMHTVFAYEFSSKKLHDQNVAFIRMISARSSETNGRRFFQMPNLGSLSYCKDTFCRMLGVSSRQYSKCLKGSQDGILSLDSILRGPEKGKPFCLRKARKKSVEQNGNMLHFFEVVIMEPEQSSVRSLYKRYLAGLGWIGTIDKKGNYSIMATSKDAKPFCSWTKFRQCWATYSSP